MQKTYEDGIRDGVRFAVDSEEHYDRSGRIAPSTPDHLFGDAVLTMTPRGELFESSRAHLDKRIRAITHSALENFIHEKDTDNI